MTSDVSSVQAWIGAVSSALEALPGELQGALGSDTFADVLARALAPLEAGPVPEALTGGTGATGTALSTGAQGLPADYQTFGSVTALDSSTDAASSSDPALEPAEVDGAGSVETSVTTGPTGGGVSGGRVSGAEVVDAAEKFLGTPYVWGGDTPSGGFDCSGLVQYVYGEMGVDLPRTTYAQVKVGTPVDSLTSAAPGDLVFFAGSDGTPSAPGHVGIYVGNGLMVDAPDTGSSVQVQPVAAAGQVVAVRRILSTGGTGPDDGSELPSTSVSGFESGTARDVSAAVPPALVPLFVSAAGTYGVPVSLLTAVAYQESHFDTTAESPAGAEGMMQLMPATAKDLGVTPFTAGQAIDGAARLLSGYLARYDGSVPLALAAYNAGPAAVARFGGVPPYSQTGRYVSSVMALSGLA